MRVTHEVLAKTARLWHAMTIYSSQSRTPEGVVRICTGNAPGVVHRCFTRNLLLVAASWAPYADKVFYCFKEIELCETRSAAAAR